MIIPTTDIFWMIRVEGEAAENVANTLSPRSTNDIKEVVLISDDYDNDIQAMITLDEAVAKMKAELPEGTVEKSSLNPLYLPSTPEQIDSVMADTQSEDMMAFTGMDGSPFTMKTVDVSFGDRDVIQGKVTCRPFDLPSYNEILREQAKVVLN